MLYQKIVVYLHRKTKDKQTTTKIERDKKMKIYAIKSNDTRSGYRYYMRNALAKMMGATTWQLRLTDTDNETVDKDSHLYYEGNDASVILDEIYRNNGWGVWAITEVKQNTGSILDDVFDNAEPRQYLISLEEVSE